MRVVNLIEGSDEYNRLNELVGRILDEINDCGVPLRHCLIQRMPVRR